MPNKWIEISSVRQPAAKVAKRVLEVRVQHVERMLPLATWNHTEDAEYVHRLRVACRRAGAALQAFRPLMAEKPTSLRRWLRRIRQAAGPARDSDVLLGRIKQEDQVAPFSEYVLARLQQQRIDVQQQLLEVEKRSQRDPLVQSLQPCLASLNSVSRKRNRTIGRFAKLALQKASQPILKLALNEQPSLDQLHELRIACKRLRYSIELFHAAFPLELRTEFYPYMEDLQGRLGKLNDHATAQAMFQHWLAQMPADSRAAELARCIIAEHELTEQLRTEFLDGWEPDRIARLESYLGSLK